MSEPTFPTVTHEQWRAQASRDLRGRPLAKLTHRTLDGLEVTPLYTRDDELDAGPLMSGPGPTRAAGWASVQELRHADPADANLAARRDLELGAHGVRIVLDTALQVGREPGGEHDGLICDPEQDLDALLAGVDPRQTPVLIDAGLQAPNWADHLEEWVDNLPARADADQTAGEAELGRGPARGGVIYDPLGVLATVGSLELDIDAALGRSVDLILGMEAGLLGVSTCPYHEAGASDGHELALALASCAELLRRGAPFELEIGDLARTMLWTLPLTGRPFEAVAKLRAARVVWAKFCVAAGLDVEQDRPRLWIHATSSRREWTRHGPWVNLLRGTVGSFAAALGGADMVATAAFDGLRGPERDAVAGLGRGSELGRRLAINTQLILRDESQLGRVIDPARGSAYVEALTDQLARAAWRQFQAIEASGGVVAGLCSGVIQSQIEQTASRLREQVATRRRPLTGLSTDPVLDDQPTPDQAPNHSQAAGPPPARMGPVIDPIEIPPLAPLRLAAGFEALRDRSAGLAARPRIHACALAELADHQARLDFAANAFRAGGVALVAGDGLALDDAGFADRAAASFRASGCAIAVICGRDQDYARAAGPLVAALRRAGARAVWIAGRPPGPDDPPWGLDADSPPRFVHRGCDLLAELDRALALVDAGEGQGS